MELIIDAQIVKAYYEEMVIGSPHNLTESPVLVFERLCNQLRVNLDESGQIENEWRAPVDPEWFEAWLATLLTSGEARLVPTEACGQLRTQLRNLGFPTTGRAGRDFWYIRTAVGVIGLIDPLPHGRDPLVYIISEDLHFHSPGEYGTASSDRRAHILTSGNGPIVQFLRRRQRIEISCVQNFLQYI
jgi:hypothetical protein